MTSTRLICAELLFDQDCATLFEYVADPSRQPSWDGNDNLAEAPAGQRIHAVGDVFTMVLTNGQVRHNHVVEFIEGRVVAWCPSEVGQPLPGHLWRWEFTPQAANQTLVRHSYDWSRLTDPQRLPKAAAKTPANLMASLRRLQAVVATNGTGN